MVFENLITLLEIKYQFYKFQLSILSEFWKSIHQEILDRNDLVDAMNDDNLEGNIWAVEQEIIALEKMVQSFLSTRKNVFPKFGLCSDQKLKFIFCSHSIQHTNDWVSFIFPQVSKLIIQKVFPNLNVTLKRFGVFSQKLFCKY